MLSLCIIHPCPDVLAQSLSSEHLKQFLLQEYDTLDSSNSGGKTSFDSAGSRHVPEKRSRKLSRPKSLTNLVWDLRGTFTSTLYINQKKCVFPPKPLSIIHLAN